MAQNEMKAKPALPERVRSMEGLGIWCTKPLFEDLPYRRPLIVDDAVAERVALTPIWHDALVTDDAFLFGAKAEDGGPGLRICFIGRELNANARQFFECEPQHEVLSLCVDERSLPG